MIEQIDDHDGDDDIYDKWKFRAPRAPDFQAAGRPEVGKNWKKNWKKVGKSLEKIQRKVGKKLGKKLEKKVGKKVGKKSWEKS